jgi:hypothetical protein
MTVFASALPLLVWVLLVALPCSVGAQISTAPPPGCLCPMSLCCREDGGNATDPNSLLGCSFFFGHTLGIVQDFCKPYVNGTLDASTGVCDAILADDYFRDRFVTDGSSLARDASVWLRVDADASCSELVADACSDEPEPSPVLSWSSSSEGSCSKIGSDYFSVEANTTVPLFSSMGCAEESDGVLNLLVAEEFPFQDAPTCPETASLQFSGDTSNGIEHQRWMCYDYRNVQNGIVANFRLLYVNLGDLPCGGSTPVATGAPTSSAPPAKVAVLGFLVFGFWVTEIAFCF